MTNGKKRQKRKTGRIQPRRKKLFKNEIGLREDAMSGSSGHTSPAVINRPLFPSETETLPVSAAHYITGV